MINPIKVSGLGASLPGNQLTVQLKDQSGGVLTQQVAPLDAQGNWSTQLQVNVGCRNSCDDLCLRDQPSG